MLLLWEMLLWMLWKLNLDERFQRHFFFFRQSSRNVEYNNWFLFHRDAWHLLLRGEGRETVTAGEIETQRMSCHLSSEVENGVTCCVKGPCIHSHCATCGRDKWCDWAGVCVFVTCRYFLVCMHTLILLRGNTAVPLTYYSWWSVSVCTRVCVCACVCVCVCVCVCLCVCQVPAVNSLRPFRRAQAFINKRSSNATFVWAEVTQAPQCISSLPFPPSCQLWERSGDYSSLGRCLSHWLKGTVA